MKFEQPDDFRDESEALYLLLAARDDADFARITQFKAWTIDDVVRHLHVWNQAADLSLRDGEAFLRFRRRLRDDAKAGLSTREIERNLVDGARGVRLLETWRAFCTEMAERFAAADPATRVRWAGPDMSVRSSISARLMETWAHGQALYDVLGVERRDSDRIRNIAVLGVNTFAWSFANRRLAVPERAPHLRLRAPSGVVWTFNQPSEDELVEGEATEFCQVVSQVRNVGDTRLRVVGETAQRWLSIAQCFAGPPHEPPAPGSRYRIRGLPGDRPEYIGRP